VTKVGTIYAASATSGAVNELSPDKKIIGMAKPTMPLITPATNAIARAIRNKCSGRIAKIMSILADTTTVSDFVAQNESSSMRKIKTICRSNSYFCCAATAKGLSNAEQF
jgi:hypothetical protein